MKKLLYIFLMVFITGILNSCFENEESLAEKIETSPNLVGFDANTLSLTTVADGTTKNFNIPIRLFGPTAVEQDNNVTATISIDESKSTAVEGTHYRLNASEITLSEDSLYLGRLPITVLSEGIEPPLAQSPVLVLNVESVNGISNVIPSSKQIVLSFYYLCDSDLSGIYSVTISDSRCTSPPYGPNFPFLVEIKANADGSWNLSSADGGFLGRCTGNAGLDNAGNIVELCGEIQPSTDLDYASSGIGMISGGTWDAEAGILILEHTQDFTSNWPGSWTSTYVRQ